MVLKVALAMAMTLVAVESVTETVVNLMPVPYVTVHLMAA